MSSTSQFSTSTISTPTTSTTSTFASSSTNPKFTAKQDGKLPPQSTPFHIARRVSDLGTLAQGGADLGPTSQAIVVGSDIDNIDGLKNLPIDTKIELNKVVFKESRRKSGDDYDEKNNNRSKYKVVYKVVTPADSSKSSDRTDTASNTKNISEKDYSKDSLFSHMNGLSDSDGSKYLSTYSFHFSKRPASSASLEGLVEKELKNLIVNDKSNDKHDETEKNTTTLSDHSDYSPMASPSTAASLSPTSSTSSSPTSSSFKYKTVNSPDQNEPPHFVRNCKWVPPKTFSILYSENKIAGGTNDNRNNNSIADTDAEAIEEARARWFSYENYKDLMYSTLHDGTGPAGPAGTGVPSQKPQASLF